MSISLVPMWFSAWCQSLGSAVKATGVALMLQKGPRQSLKKDSETFLFLNLGDLAKPTSAALVVLDFFLKQHAVLIVSEDHFSRPLSVVSSVSYLSE